MRLRRSELDVGPDFGLILCIRGGSEKVEKDLRASLVAAGSAAALSALVAALFSGLTLLTVLAFLVRAWPPMVRRLGEDDPGALHPPR